MIREVAAPLELEPALPGYLAWYRRVVNDRATLLAPIGVRVGLKRDEPKAVKEVVG